MKKNLLVFFGELRTFDLVIPQLKNIEEFDVLVSTWNTTNIWYKDSVETKNVNPETITSILKDAKVLLSEDVFLYKKHPTWKMYYHWKIAINSIENGDVYEKVILLRCDGLCELNKILEQEFEKNTLYIENGSYDLNSFWVGDYIFGGDFQIMKRFVNLFDKDNYDNPHYPIGDVIIKNKINWKPINSRTELIKFKYDIFFKYLNDNNKYFFDIECNSKHMRIFNNLIEQPGR